MGVMLVTGGGRGIGAAICKLAGKSGWHVAVNYSRSEAAAAKVVEEIRSAGGTAEAFKADVGSEQDVMRMFEAIDRKLGPIGAVVNNAAIDHATRVQDFQVADLLRVF